MLAGWWQGLAGRPEGGCGLPVSHQVYHVSAVAAEGPIFLLGCPGNNCFGREGRRVLPGFGLQALSVLKQVGV